ncbi:MAG: phage head closure protein [Pseudolabrys sp.]
MINPGDLDRRLVIEAPVETADDAGGVVRSYADAATMWASVQPETMRADVEADAAGAALGYRILMRAGRDLTTRHRLRDGVQRYRILAVREGRERRAGPRFLEIRAELIAD